jgi:GDP-L-fucose synthase
MNKNSKILVTGGNGLVGSAIVRLLYRLGFNNIYDIAKKDCDLVNTDEVLQIFNTIKPDYVFHTAARVYGIGGNLNNKASSFYDNIMLNTNVINACQLVNVKKVLAIGTIASYPYDNSIPILKEDLIFSGKPHTSEDSYGYAKRAMLAMLNAYRESYSLNWSYVISTNIYGPNDKFDIVNGHVVPSLIKKFYDAKLENKDVTIWGDGSANRNFMYVDDLAKALILIIDNFQGAINVGTTEVVSIKKLVETIATISDFKNEILWDKDKPNGRDFMACDLTNLDGLGFKPDYDLRSGLSSTWSWLNENYDSIRL